MFTHEWIMIVSEDYGASDVKQFVKVIDACNSKQQGKKS